MISEQDKKAILNGVLARTNNNKKAKFILKSEHEANFNYPYLFLISDKDKCYTDWYNEHLNSKQDKFNSSIVELWQDEPEPLDLERALAGEPVMLRNKSKAYAKYVLPLKYRDTCPLTGYIIDPTDTDKVQRFTWTLNGKATNKDVEHIHDIIGMWREPEPVSNSVTVTLPCPLKEPQDKMWFVDLDGATRSSYDKSIPVDDFKRTPYFGAEAHAQAWFDAMQNSRK